MKNIQLYSMNLIVFSCVFVTASEKPLMPSGGISYAHVVEMPEPAPGAFQVSLPKPNVAEIAPDLTRFFGSLDATVSVYEHITTLMQNKDTQELTRLNDMAKRVFDGSDDQQRAVISLTDYIDSGINELYNQHYDNLHQQHLNNTLAINQEMLHFKNGFKKNCLIVACCGAVITSLNAFLRGTASCDRQP